MPKLTFEKSGESEGRSFMCILHEQFKERYTHLNAEFQRLARRGKKAFLSEQCKEIEENNRMGKTRGLFKKIRNIREHFMQRWAQ